MNAINNEYFCHCYGQLRLNISGQIVTNCRSCGSANIVIGEIGELDKAKLKAEW